MTQKKEVPGAIVMAVTMGTQALPAKRLGQLSDLYI